MGCQLKKKNRAIFVKERKKRKRSRRSRSRSDDDDEKEEEEEGKKWRKERTKELFTPVG